MGMRIARGMALSMMVVGGVPALAQSGEDDSELFPTDERILRIGDAEENVTFAPFVQLDAGRTWLSPGPDDTDAQVRLARLYVFATKGDLSGTLAYEFDNGRLRYAFATYQIDDAWAVRVGQQDEPFSLQDMSGSRFLPFAEAGQSANLIPGDTVGAALRYGGGDHSLSVGVFGGDVDIGLARQGVAITGRATWAPIYRESEIERGGDATRQGTGTKRVEDLLHLGLGLSARYDIDGTTSFAGGPGSSLLSRSLATSPDFAHVDSLYRVNLEASREIGPLSIQGEWTGSRLSAPQMDGANAHGGYLYTTYFLTGERRGYNPSTGAFGRVVPIDPVDEGGVGAVEIGARADYLDLTDLGPDGGAQWGLSGVVNVYLTKRFTVTGDYGYTRVTAGGSDGLEAHALTFRAQFAY